MSRRADEHGSATLLVVACAGVLLFVGCALAVVSAVFVAHRTAQAAADLAALAAAETLRTGGDACQVAEEVAVANGAVVASCVTEGLVAAVVTTVTGPHWLGWHGDPRGRARAGPASAAE